MHLSERASGLRRPSCSCAAGLCGQGSRCANAFRAQGGEREGKRGGRAKLQSKEIDLPGVADGLVSRLFRLPIVFRRKVLKTERVSLM